MEIQGTEESFPQPKGNLNLHTARANCKPGRMFMWKSSYLDTSWRNFRTPKDKEKILKASRRKTKQSSLPTKKLSWMGPTQGFINHKSPHQPQESFAIPGLHVTKSLHQMISGVFFSSDLLPILVAKLQSWSCHWSLPDEPHQAAPLHHSTTCTAEFFTALCFKGACAFASWTHADSSVQSFLRTETIV